MVDIPENKNAVSKISCAVFIIGLFLAAFGITLMTIDNPMIGITAALTAIFAYSVSIFSGVLS